MDSSTASETAALPTQVAALELAELPSVSVVIPTVDRPEMLARAIQAVVDQDYPGQIEIVVVFDHVAPTLGDSQPAANRQVRVTTNTRTQGLAGNRNSGVLLATGDLVCPCDDDDEWLPSKVSAQVALFRTQPELVVVGCGFFINSDGKDTARPAPAEQLTLRDFLRSRHMELNSSTYMVRRADMLGRVGLIDEELPGGYAEDYEWVIRAARQGPVACVAEPLVRIYWHSSSFFGSRWKTIISALEYLIDQVPEFADEPKGRSRIEGQLAFAHAALGQRRTAVDVATRALRHNPGARQAWAALAVSSGVVSADRVMAMGRRVGRGV